MNKKDVIDYIERCYALGVPAVVDGHFDVTLIQDKIYLKSLIFDIKDTKDKLSIKFPEYIYGLLTNSINLVGVEVNSLYLHLNKIEFINTGAVLTDYGTKIKIIGPHVVAMGVRAICCKLGKGITFYLKVPKFVGELPLTSYVKAYTNTTKVYYKDGVLKFTGR